MHAKLLAHYLSGGAEHVRVDSPPLPDLSICREGPPAAGFQRLVVALGAYLAGDAETGSDRAHWRLSQDPGVADWR